MPMCIPLDDPAYPPLLATVDDAPPLLFFRGGYGRHDSLSTDLI